MSKHTPGPWAPEFGEAYRVRAQQDGGQVAIMMNLKGRHGLAGRRTGEEVAANARLIAAAPELLAALRIAREHIQIDRNSFKEAHSFPDGFMEREDQSTLKQLDQKLAVIDAAIANAEGGEE